MRSEHRVVVSFVASLLWITASEVRAQEPPLPDPVPEPEPPPPTEPLPPSEPMPPTEPGQDPTPEPVQQPPTEPPQEEEKTPPAETPLPEQAPPSPEEMGPHLEVYGFAMLDMGYQFGQADPQWFDTLRPTKLPSFEDEYGGNGHFFASVRQSRFGVKGFAPTPVGELQTIFEFELFGTGVDAGQTTFRLRHAWVELWQIGAGQTWSPFMDPDVFPNSIEYWGPNGMVFFRNVQLRWTPVKSDLLDLMLAIERPGASADQGVYGERIELAGVKGRFPFPDVSGRARFKGDWGHVQAAGILRYISWDDFSNDAVDLSDWVIGWGFNLSSNIKLWDDVVKLQAVYGHGIQNYMNDAPEDVGIEPNSDDETQPIVGVPLPLLGLVAFYDRTWNDYFTSTIGYSLVWVNNSEGQAADAFRLGQYALVNLLFYPVEGLMMGPELQWGRRDNNSDGFDVNDFRIQFSVKGNFSGDIRGSE